MSISVVLTRHGVVEFRPDEVRYMSLSVSEGTREKMEAEARATAADNCGSEGRGIWLGTGPNPAHFIIHGSNDWHSLSKTFGDCSTLGHGKNWGSQTSRPWRKRLAEWLRAW
jgi:hypothetical protein